AQEEREDVRQREEEQDDDHGERRGEITCELAAQDDADRFHGGLREDQAATARNRSSSLPDGERARSAAGVSSATSLPCAMMMARVQTASTSSRMCVEMTMVFSRAISPINVRTSCFCSGSR